MSIESRHAYRCVFLKSEKWQAVRLEVLMREGGKCELCAEESALNDAHHIWYPKNIYDTVETQLAVLCRPCHEFVHAMLPECKTGDEEFGRSQWLKFKTAVIMWRAQKIIFLSGQKGLSEKSIKMLFIANKRLSRDIGRNEKLVLQSVDYTKSFLIHVADDVPSRKGQVYCCSCNFKLPSRVTWIIDDIPTQDLRKPDRSVKALWANRVRIRQFTELNSDKDVHMVKAKALKGIAFHQHDWDLSMMARSHAITSFLTSLEDNWPCFISYS